MTDEQTVNVRDEILRNFKESGTHVLVHLPYGHSVDGTVMAYDKDNLVIVSVGKVMSSPKKHLLERSACIWIEELLLP